MADIRISALTPAAALAGGEALPVVQGGATVRATPAQLAAFARANRVEQVAFAAAVPLDGSKIMAQQVIAAPIAFTAPTAPVAGASCYVRLVADGTNVPAFPAASFAEHGSSAGFLNVAGAVNTVEFWFDGTVIYYAINQAANVAPFAAGTAYVSGDAPATVVLTYPYALNTGAVPAGAAFAVAASGGGVAASTVTVASRSVTLALSRAITAGETVSVTYARPASNPLLDQNGNAVSTSATAATNGVLAAGLRYLRFAVANMAESANVAGGYDYAPNAGTSNYGGDGRGACANAIPAGQDGFWMVQTQADDVGRGVMIGLATTTAVNGYGDIAYTVYQAGSAGAPSHSSPGAGGSASNDLWVPAGRWIRIRRAGGSIFWEVSADATPASFAVVYTWTGVSAAALYPAFAGASASLGPLGIIGRPIGSANVA